MWRPTWLHSWELISFTISSWFTVGEEKSHRARTSACHRSPAGAVIRPEAWACCPVCPRTEANCHVHPGESTGRSCPTNIPSPKALPCLPVPSGLLAPLSSPVPSSFLAPPLLLALSSFLSSDPPACHSASATSYWGSGYASALHPFGSIGIPSFPLAPLSLFPLAQSAEPPAPPRPVSLQLYLGPPDHCH